MNKTQKQINQTLESRQWQRNATGSVGVIITYDKYSNTATVLVSKPETDEADEILHNVPCPTFIGVQMAAPEPGRPCYVLFKNGMVTQPLISHFYNHRYLENDLNRQSPSHMNLPTYMLG